MTLTFEAPFQARPLGGLSARFQRVLATTQADWHRPLTPAPAVHDDEEPRARRRCSLLSRPGRRTTPAYEH